MTDQNTTAALPPNTLDPEAGYSEKHFQALRTTVMAMQGLAIIDAFEILEEAKGMLERGVLINLRDEQIRGWGF